MALSGMVKIQITATRWHKFDPDVGSSFPREFAPNAFDSDLRAKGYKTPIWVSHRPWEKLPGVTGVSVKATKQGLMCEATLNTHFEQSADVVLAIQHGWLNEASIQWVPKAEKLRRDSNGKYYWLTTAAELLEISVCPKGLVAGTNTTLVNKSLIISTAPARPKRYEDCQRLARFLARIDHPLNIWTDAQKPVPFREPLMCETPEWQAALKVMQARDAKRKAIEADRRAVQSLYDGSVVVLDPRSGEMVPYGDFSCGGRPVLGSRSMCLV